MENKQHKIPEILAELNSIVKRHELTGNGNTSTAKTCKAASELLGNLMVAAEITLEVLKECNARLAGTDQNPMGFRDLLYSAHRKAEEWRLPQDPKPQPMPRITF